MERNLFSRRVITQKTWSLQIQSTQLLNTIDTKTEGRDRCGCCTSANTHARMRVHTYACKYIHTLTRVCTRVRSYFGSSTSTLHTLLPFRSSTCQLPRKQWRRRRRPRKARQHRLQWKRWRRRRRPRREERHQRRQWKRWRLWRQRVLIFRIFGPKWKNPKVVTETLRKNDSWKKQGFL